MERKQTGGDATKLRAKGTGTAEWRNGHWWVKVSMPDSTRPRYRLCLDGACTCEVMSDAMKEERCKAISERERAKAKAELAAQEVARKEKRLTVQKFGEQWTTGKLYESHGDVNALREKKSAKSDGYRLAAYVYPEIGAKPVADVTEQDIENVMAAAERKARKRMGRAWRKGARFQVYQVMRRLFDLAIRPGRLRADSPVSEYLRPGRDTQKLFGYLFPSELLAVLKCDKVPVERRVLYALAVYTGLRKGSLYALTWQGIDFQHRTITSLQSKTGLPQMFEAPESLMALLALWHAHQGAPKAGAVVSRSPTREREARVLRDDLEAAEIDRPTLLGKGGDNVQALRFHDLRATFVTWAMRDGKGDGWISDRTGHLTPEMRARYARAARTLSDLDYQPFPDISAAIPELAQLPSNVVQLKRTEHGK